MGKNLDAISEIITEHSKQQVPLQTTWGKVVSVDWSKKTMTVKGIVDDLEYYDVLLGFGSEYRRPKEDCKCLIGTIDNKEAASYLIYAEEIEEFELTDTKGFKLHLNKGKMTINGDQYGSLIKIESLVNKINEIENAFNNHIVEFNTHFHNAPQAPTGTIPTLPPLVTSSLSLQNTQSKQIENENVKHG